MKTIYYWPLKKWKNFKIIHPENFVYLGIENNIQMKKIFFTILCLSLFHMMNAQETELDNRFIIGGSLNFTHQNNSHPYSFTPNSGLGAFYSNNLNDSQNTSYVISPYIGKEITSNLHIGLKFGYRKGIYKVDDVLIFGQIDPVDFERKSNHFNIGLFTRHNLNPNNRLSFYLQPYLGYTFGYEDRFQNSKLNQEETVNYFEVGVGLGALYNINDRIRATIKTGGIEYISGKWKIKNLDVEKKFSSYGLNLNLSTIFFGFEIRV